jgi:hypothetical protein
MPGNTLQCFLTPLQCGTQRTLIASFGFILGAIWNGWQYVVYMCTVENVSAMTLIAKCLLYVLV